MKKLRVIYEANFILVIAVASTAYIHSTYLYELGTPIPEGILFTFGSLGALGTTLLSTFLFRKFGLKTVTTFTGIIGALAFATLGINVGIIISIIAFIISISSIALIVLGFDIIIKEFTPNNLEGEVRGINLALGNLAFLIGPIAAGLIAEEFTIASVYFFSAISLLVMIAFFHSRFKNFSQKKETEKSNILTGMKNIWVNSKIRNSYISGFMIEFFFAIWAIFTTLYMHEIVGFHWAEIGLLFALMHIPYIILEPIIGDIADKNKNERILMITGLVIIAVSFVGVALIDSTSMILWAILLILTRVGASFGQVAHESYFFRNLQTNETNIISAYRTMSPLALLFGPFLGSIILLFTDYPQLFMIVSIALLLTTLSANRLTYEKI